MRDTCGRSVISSSVGRLSKSLAPVRASRPTPPTMGSSMPASRTPATTLMIPSTPSRCQSPLLGRGPRVGTAPDYGGRSSRIHAQEGQVRTERPLAIPQKDYPRMRRTGAAVPCVRFVLSMQCSARSALALDRRTQPMPWTQDWTTRAACRNDAPDTLFVQGAAQNRAKSVCLGCPVRTECLADSLDNRVEFGVWGGMTERERRALLRRRPNVTSWRRLLEAAMIDFENAKVADVIKQVTVAS